MEEHPEQLLSPGYAQAVTPSRPPAASVEDVQDAGEQSVSDAQRGYFPPSSEPFVPSPLSQSPGTVPSAPPPVSSQEVHIPMQTSPQIPAKMPPSFAPQPSRPWTNTLDPPSIASSVPRTSPGAEPVVAAAAHTTHPGHTVSVAPIPNPKSIEQAQKHAKWAISALNFEDIPTAVQELRNALAMLGSQ